MLYVPRIHEALGEKAPAEFEESVEGAKEKVRDDVHLNDDCGHEHHHD